VVSGAYFAFAGAAPFSFTALIAFDSRDLIRAAELACTMFFAAAWSSFYTAVRNSVSHAAASPPAIAVRTLRTCVRMVERAARLRARRLRL
jgi:hypothetical protein